MSLGNIITLSNEKKIPQIGLGTWLSEPKEVEYAVEWAVKAGYRHLDCAMVYENQDEVGAALKKVIPSIVKREDLFITSKLWNTSHRPENAEPELDDTLKQLGVDYLDLYLIHWPCAFPGPYTNGLFPPHPTIPNQIALDMEVSLVDTWKKMIELQKTGKVKTIGVSNFTIEYIKAITKATGVKPVVNQVEAHPLLPQDDLVAFCKEEGIHLTAYSPLGNNLAGKTKLVDYPAVKEVADKLGATTAQVLVAWGAYRGYSVIPKSVKEERIKSNFKQIVLSPEDYEKISAIGKDNHTRFNTPAAYNPKWDINMFNEPAELSATYKVKIE
ncbi:Aldo/keto reductase [Stereum hirsutum FP-91666 SS1]|uniref:Aldo/keto reductase n=1 Tax=Stereum hirsutum (strain FP-91666) TaxID=721885 RepID=UPI0004449BC5|nr:Aldo/keto reductase [Stereum hirsutum FP-91666 SS1]EIM80886.1 Aldo/keto reductase [Stereum hirsutum FP-91666 SS1]